MTNKEENQQNLSTSFKLKLIKKDLPGLNGTSFKINVGKGLYEQLKSQNANRPNSPSQPFSLDLLRDTFGEYFNQKQQTRNIKITTNQAGFDLFQEAMKKEAEKQLKNEYRKKFDLRSKVFKQTYKFRQQHNGQSDLWSAKEVWNTPNKKGNKS